MQMSDFYPDDEDQFGFPLPFGKYHRGKQIEMLIITEPVYIGWLHGKDIYPQFRDVEKRIRWCIKRFDEKPFVTRCHTRGCDRPVTKCTLYPNSPFPLYWCDHCEPVLDCNVAMPASTYRHILHFLNVWCHNNRKLGRVLLRRFATAKGMPAALTTRAVVDWFYG